LTNLRGSNFNSGGQIFLAQRSLVGKGKNPWKDEFPKDWHLEGESERFHSIEPDDAWQDLLGPYSQDSPKLAQGEKRKSPLGRQIGGWPSRNSSGQTAQRSTPRIFSIFSSISSST